MVNLVKFTSIETFSLDFRSGAELFLSQDFNINTYPYLTGNNYGISSF